MAEIETNKFIIFTNGDPTVGIPADAFEFMAENNFIFSSEKELNDFKEGLSELIENYADEKPEIYTEEEFKKIVENEKRMYKELREAEEEIKKMLDDEDGNTNIDSIIYKDAKRNL